MRCADHTKNAARACGAFLDCEGYLAVLILSNDGAIFGRRSHSSDTWPQG